MLKLMVALSLTAATLTAAETPASIAMLVTETDIGARVGAALSAPDPLTRAAAARVALVRDLRPLLPQVREALAHETDRNAIREEVRTLAVLGEPSDVDLAITSTRTLPRGIDQVITDAVARRDDALALLPRLREARMAPQADFMTQTLWQRPALSGAAASLALGRHEVDTWQILVDALRRSEMAMPAGPLAASLNVSSEEIRAASVWYLVHGYARDPEQIAQPVRDALAAPKEEASMREAFGRALLRRMLGGEQASDPRWVQWLQSAEADAAINNNELIFAWFTDEEFMTRKRYCDLSSNECRTPSVRTKKSATHTVAQPDFQLPEVLPPGLADAIAAQNRCSQSWLATASATADRAGRVRDVELHRLQIDNACAATVTALMKLSLVRPVSIASPARANGIILARARRASVCLDESPLSDRAATLMHTGGDVTAPIVKRRVEPNFPSSARVAMSQGGYRTVLVITEATISTTGCVRSLKLLAQSDYPEMNGAAIEALSQWQFEPGRLHGVPVDVIFNLTINFKLGP